MSQLRESSKIFMLQEVVDCELDDSFGDILTLELATIQLAQSIIARYYVNKVLFFWMTHQVYTIKSNSLPVKNCTLFFTTNLCYSFQAPK